jgi:hypothetical protein
MRFGKCAAAVVLLAGAAAAQNCSTVSTLTVLGTVHRIETMREEPQAEPETFFIIRVDQAVCGKNEITANTIGPIACKEGEFINATGRFTPPSPMFDTARLELKPPVICRTRP